MNSQSFPGFPVRASLTPLPDIFFSELLPEISSLPEIKVILHIFWRLNQKKEITRFITYDELESDKILLKGLGTGANATAVLKDALKSAVDRGVLLHMSGKGEDGRSYDIYFVNSESGKRALSKIEVGELSLRRLPDGRLTVEEERPNIFVLYEQHIGLINPSVAEELKEAEMTYPASWIEEAFQEASSLNKRNWRYISRILERWSTEGKNSGESGRNLKKRGSPSRYLDGRYGHLIRR